MIKRRGAAGTVLIVDDDETTRRLLARVLLTNGFACRYAADGEAGVRAAVETCPDLIVMDVVMPRLGGLAAIDHLRADARTSAIPVVVMTGSCEETLLAECRAVSAACLVKPAPPDELVATIRRALWESEQPAASQSSDTGARLALVAGSWPRCA